MIIMKDKDVKKWANGFSVKVLKLITIGWIAFMIYASVMMAIAIYQTGEFSYLDTFIMEICGVFKMSVIGVLLTRTIGNVFQYNNGGIFGTSVNGNEDVSG